MNKCFYKLHELVSTPLAEGVAQKDQWSKVPYEAKGQKGTALVAGQCSKPLEIEVDLKVKGWHKIYIALGSIGGGASCVQIKLSNEMGKTIISPTNIDSLGGYPRWQGYEYAEESFFKAADLTGQKLIFAKPESLTNCGVSVVLYVRLEEMTEEETQTYKQSGKEKRIMWHFDSDYFTECDYKKPEEYLGRLQMLENGNGDIFVQECFLEGYPNDYHADKTPWKQIGLQREYRKVYLDKQWEVKHMLAQQAQKMGMKIYGGYRLECGDFQIPYDPNFCNDGAPKKYPQFRCLTRDGHSIQALSYAYAEVRKMMVDTILSTLPDEWDGVSVFFHRGILVGIDLPVIEEVQRRFGVDARRLPRSDARLHTVLCEYITAFMRELKVALEEKAKRANHARYEVNAVVFFDANSTKYFGCDIETLLKEGLIDSVSQGLMMHYETIEDCLADDGLIDLEKYTKKKETDFVIRRYYGDEPEYVLSGVKSFLELQKHYGGEFYAALGWENKDYPYQLELAKKIYEAGAEKLIAWNGNHIAKSCSKLWGIKACGDKERILSSGAKVHSETFRITSLNGSDISEFDPNWRG